MRRLRLLPALALALALALAIALAPGLSLARAGGGSSFGSRGSNTYSAPPATNTSPYGAVPFQRSITPQAPSYAPSPAYGSTYGRGFGGGLFGGGRPFVSGLMGGLLGAGIGGLLFGHGMFGGISGLGGFLGFLLQIFLLVLVGRWLFRRFLGGGQPAFATPGLGSSFARNAAPQAARPGFGGAAPATRQVAITQPDYLAFEQNLKLVQQAWSQHDLNTLRQVCTPEMVSYFAEQLAEQASRSVRNTVTSVHLDQGDLAQAWAEQGREYAMVAMRFSMIDVTRDSAGRVVDGSPDERVSATELWTFLRAPGARWVLSAIQQGR